MREGWPVMRRSIPVGRRSLRELDPPYGLLPEGEGFAIGYGVFRFSVKVM